MKKFEFEANDGFSLVGHVFEPVGNSVQKVVILAAATGVPQRFYLKFGQFLSENGFSVISFDYRGIGLSRTRALGAREGSYSDWADRDLRAAINWAENAFPNYKKFVIGHSFGGNCLGLTEKSLALDGIVTVASQFGYWRNFGSKRYPSYFFFLVVMPFLSRAMGYFPSKWFGLGENLPKQAALDWCVFITKPDSQLELARRLGQNYYAKITKPMLILGIDDDSMAPPRAVRELAERLYPNAEKQVQIIEKSNFSKEPIGHLNFFREKFKDNLWQIVLKWLNEQ